MQPEPVDAQPGRFYDGGPIGGSPPVPHEEPQVVLERHVRDGVECFEMERAIAYADRELGELVVPASVEFRTDLTSVPWLFTWLVPRTGAHLPAALLHDGLVAGEDDAVSYVSKAGHVVTRDVADRVFRDAMADTGTGVVRRWVVWSAVAAATIFVGSAAWSRSRWTYYRVAAAGSLGLVVLLGVLATIDLVDLATVLPWMGERPWWSELVGGLSVAVVVPLVLGLTWGRFRVAGMVLGVLLAVLLHVTAALLALTALYQGVERLAQRSPRGALAVAAAVGAVSLLVALTYTLT
ncbi:DUF1353 domain-containing protein [Nocardioides coralli]|uniref:DUF1353 domain-containing protein n=1 Tax=Nocardioides coralli TaxID=2872154 RepID=UPI001CA387FA|nr:DUF1353 domain-containing protein [Nocardioides coralli]QZY28533.1 DUF1353 domain-containing protein [Nocardioides coralli]